MPRSTIAGETHGPYVNARVSARRAPSFLKSAVKRLGARRRVSNSAASARWRLSHLAVAFPLAASRLASINIVSSSKRQ